MKIKDAIIEGNQPMVSIKQSLMEKIYLERKLRGENEELQKSIDSKKRYIDTILSNFDNELENRKRELLILQGQIANAKNQKEAIINA